MYPCLANGQNVTEIWEEKDRKWLKMTEGHWWTLLNSMTWLATCAMLVPSKNQQRLCPGNKRCKMLHCSLQGTPRECNTSRPESTCRDFRRPSCSSCSFIKIIVASSEVLLLWRMGATVVSDTPLISACIYSTQLPLQMSNTGRKRDHYVRRLQNQKRSQVGAYQPANTTWYWLCFVLLWNRSLGM